MYYIYTSNDCLVILPCSLVKTLTVSRNSMKRHSTEYDMFKNMFKHQLLVSTPLKNMSSSVGNILPNIWKVIKFHGSKSPTSYDIPFIMVIYKSL